MEYGYEGSESTIIDERRASEMLDAMLEQMGALKRVLLLPPDFTRAHSWAGELTCLLYAKLKDTAEVAIMPALGTHFPMTDAQIERMFPGIPKEVFRVHRWRDDLVRLGEVPAEFVREVTEGIVDFSINMQINKALIEEEWDQIISIGQLVPHEVVGIANHNKNIYVGVGGQDTINKSHFIGAAYGMERMMGREKTPVREVFNYADREFTPAMPISYVLTVRAKDEDGHLVTRGLYMGNDDACFLRGARLSQKVNLDLLKEPISKAVVYLDPEEFQSTWLGNKAIYRLRMAMADGGQLIILAPGVREFGEDTEIDRLIRKYGYHGTPHTLEMVKHHQELAANLSAAAHLIHGSSEGRFTVTYCTGGLSRKEVESVGFEYAPLEEMMKVFPPSRLIDGYNDVGGESVFYVSNPALGLWALEEHFAR